MLQIIRFFLLLWAASGEIAIPEIDQYVDIAGALEIAARIDPFHRAMQTGEEIALCYDALFLADANQNREIDQEEFVDFVKLLLEPSNVLANVESFLQLPLILRSNFLILACLCLQNGGDSQCCIGDQAHINNNGAYPGDVPTEVEEEYLYMTCFLTIASINRFRESFSPTSSPASLPPPTKFPTSKPSFRPTLSSSSEPTASPSTSPSASPTTSPSTSPTVAYSGIPTTLPSTALSLSPTASPSTSPTVLHSDIPTASPSISPSASPTTSPSISPTVVHSGIPTTSPSTSPSASPTVSPSNSPTVLHSGKPSANPSMAPTTAPTTDAPSRTPSMSPSEAPSIPGSVSPSTVQNPSAILTAEPSSSPSTSTTQATGTPSPSISPTDIQLENDSPDTARDGLPPGGIAGIVLGGAIGFLLISLFLLGGRGNGSDMFLKDSENVDIEEIGKENDDMNDSSSSNAGDSGWSSNGGMSSLESSSVGDEYARSAAITPTELEIGATSGLIHSIDQDTSITTYSELDLAIQKGDWKAVGVTAALLASQYESSPSNSDGRTPSSAGSGPINKARAVELDRLVEAGDWEGVVKAAARYDSEGVVKSVPRQDAQTVGSSSKASTGSVVSGSGSSSAFDESRISAGTTGSEEKSRAQKLDEIRAEIDLLVQQVVPEERQHINEMMEQFRGREEELVETLRSMRERNIAQKARMEGQKQAKRDARAAVQNKYAAGSAAAEEESRGRLEPPQEADEDMESKEMEQKLRDAIDDENWAVVAEAASGLSEHFFVDDVSSASTRSDDNTASTTGGTLELNALVDKGDWEGVVAAASKYSEKEV